MKSEIQKSETGITAAQIDTLAQASVIPAGLPKPILQVFMETCRQHGLSPFKGEIYLVPYKGTYNTIVGINGLRVKAARTGQHAGRDDAKFDLMPDGSFKTAAQIKMSGKRPISCTVTVYRAIGGMRCPFTQTVLFDEYCPANATNKWASMPINMIAKCAEAAALRMAFADETAGLFVEEESAAMEDITVHAIEVKQEQKNALEKNRDYCMETLLSLNLDDNTHESFRLDIKDAETKQELGAILAKMKPYATEMKDPRKQFLERAKA